MLSRRTFSGKRLPVIIAFTVLLVAAFGAGCKGFFTSDTLSAISIQPPTPSVEVGQQTSVQAWGTYSPSNNRSMITSGVAWTSDTPGAVCFVVGSNCDASFTGGAATISGVAPGGTATLTAAAQGLSATAQATAYLVITNFQICLTNSSGGGETGCSASAVWNPNVTSSQQTQYFVAQGTYNGTVTDFTTEATWTITSAPVNGTLNCDNSTSPALCTVSDAATAGTYLVTVTYGTSNTATITVNVTG